MIKQRRASHEDFICAVNNALDVYDGEPLAYSNHSIAIYTGTKILAVLTCDMVWGSVAIISGILTKEVYAYPISFTRYMHWEIEKLFARGFHRIQLDVREGSKDAYRFADGLGFKFECVMKHYGPNKENHILFARTQE